MSSAYPFHIFWKFCFLETVVASSNLMPYFELKIASIKIFRKFLLIPHAENTFTKTALS